MAEVLTREVHAVQLEVSLTSNQTNILSLSLARGNVAIINELVLEARSRVGDGISTGFVAYGLDSGLLAATDVSGYVDALSDADVENSAGILALMGYTAANQEDTVNGIGLVTQAGVREQWDFRSLPILDRPMTSENPELAINVQDANHQMDVIAHTYYQVVRLTDAELQRLSPGFLDPTSRVIRFYSVPQGDPWRQPKHLVQSF